MFSWKTKQKFLLLRKRVSYYREKNVAWMGGKRSLVIQKQGQARITSTADAIAVRFPVRVTLNGNVDTSLVLVRIQSQCKAAFNLPATVTLRGDFAATPIHVKTDVELTVPPVSADCEGYAVAIAPLVQAIIEQQRPKWQADTKVTAQEPKWQAGAKVTAAKVAG